MILVTGGCRSGKSEFAEDLVKGAVLAHGDAARRPLLYIATAQITDEEMRQRVQKHRDRRDDRWETYEAACEFGELPAFFMSLHEDVCEYRGILLDSVTTLVTNLLFSCIGQMQEGEEFSFDTIDYEPIREQLLTEISRICEAARTLPIIFVTDEIGLGVVPQTALGRNFRDILGSVNQQLAAACEQVYFVVSGIPVKIKG